MRANEHGGRVYEATRRWGGKPGDWLDFSANINPLGLDRKVSRVIKKQVHHLVHYPDNGERLRALLARDIGVEPEQIILTNGAAEGFFVAVNCLCPRSALLLEPTFSEYRRALAARQIPVNHLILDGDRDFHVPWPQVEAAWSSGMLLLVCNPNNPTGKLTDLTDLLRQQELAQQHRGWLLVDESFQDFLVDPPSLVGGLGERTLLIRSLTKFFALPGLRLGYIVARKELAACLREQVPAWNVNALALAAGEVALCQENYIRRSRKLVATAGAKLFWELSQLPGVKAYYPAVNFILVHLPGNGLADFLARERILIRRCDNFLGLGPDWYRCAVRLPQENARLVRALKGFLGGR